MNAKFPLLLLVSLLISMTTSPAAGPKKKQSMDVEMTDNNSKHHLPTQDVPLPTDHSKDMGHTDKVHKPNSDDDGKHHHFHYNRISGRKRKWLALLMAKVIITIAHVCCFIYCITHPFH